MNRYITYTLITLGFIILLLSTSLISLQVGFNYGQKETAKIALKSIDTTLFILDVVTKNEVCYKEVCYTYPQNTIIKNQTFYDVINLCVNESNTCPRLSMYIKDSQTYTQLAQLAN
jgi:hypothetical protein